MDCIWNGAHGERARIGSSKAAWPALIGLAAGGTAVEAMAIGAFAIGRLAIKRAATKELTIGTLRVKRPIVRQDSPRE